MPKITITLEEPDLLALWAAVVDEDGEEALAFLQECVVPQIPAKGHVACDSTRRNPYLLRRKHDAEGAQPDAL